MEALEISENFRRSCQKLQGRKDIFENGGNISMKNVFANIFQHLLEMKTASVVHEKVLGNSCDDTMPKVT